ncbi:hypothetical protein B5807_09871 [Epicoccum nigrum]|uniref:Uncharacterized protein n=1 Tax=Epicoccum nigrum TaxID=105696 RepID=A0A1Y2LV11_EPING|nr:hypothetical protein B5807_09871 [Epicoccum nigrum]
MQTEPFLFVRSLTGLSGQLRGYVLLFKQLQRSSDRDRPAPKSNGFENEIGWDWETFLQAYSALGALRHSRSFAVSKYAIDALDRFLEFAQQIGLGIESLDLVAPNKGDIERENVDEDVDMNETFPVPHEAKSGSVTNIQSVWGSSAQFHQDSMPSVYSNFANTSAGDIAKPAPLSHQVKPVRAASDDLANLSSNFHSSMNLDAESKSPPPLPRPSRLTPSSSEQEVGDTQPGNNPSPYRSRLSRVLSNMGLGQQAQAVAQRGTAQDTSLGPIPEEEEE